MALGEGGAWLWLGDGFATGGFEFAAAEGLVALVEDLLFALDGRFEPLEVALAFGECLLAGGECRLFGCGLRALCLFQGGAFVIDAAAFSFDGIAFAGELLVGELAFELLFLFDGLTVLEFQFGEFLLRGGIGFVASRESEDGWQHE